MSVIPLKNHKKDLEKFDRITREAPDNEKLMEKTKELWSPLGKVYIEQQGNVITMEVFLKER